MIRVASNEAERANPAWNVSLQRRLGTMVAALALVGTACGRAPATQDLVVAATGEPSVLLPPLVRETVGRDISDLVYERLARLRAGGSPIDQAAFVPGLAASWRQRDSLTWEFTLRPDATWHDGTPVTTDDVLFSYAAFVDTALGAPGSPALDDVAVTAEGAGTVVLRFPRAHAEQLFDATNDVRILPRHLWDSVPRADWGADTALSRLVGSGPYRIASWVRGQSLVAERVRGNGFGRIAWRFGADQDAALNLVLTGEADILETVTSPSARERAGRDSAVTALPYASAVYGYLGFQLENAAGRPHPVLADRQVRQALTHAIDRATLVHAVIGADAAVPPGPMSRASWIWNDSVKTLGFDAARAGALLDEAGWRPGAAGIRRRGTARLAVDILVPSTSTARRQLAEGVQQMWKDVGVAATITAVDFPVFQQRLSEGRFDAMVGAWLDNPSPRSLEDQWTRAGFGGRNYGRYDSPAFDRLFAAASAARTPAAGAPLWREALDTLNADAPAVFLYNPTNVAVASRRLAGVTIDPFSWLAEVGSWMKNP
ncbi:MAG: peptide ABC transporter substrate-binding protein [Gemmatimonadales bacterium]